MDGPLPPEFVEFHRGRGDEVRAWLTRLPDVIEHCAAVWGLDVKAHFPQLSYNYVASAIRADGSHAVLKIGVPGRDFASEAAALAAFDGRGVVRLLDADVPRGAMLLERVWPGGNLESLAAIDDARATSIAARAMRTMWCEPPEDARALVTVAQWFDGFARARQHHGFGRLPAAHVDRAERMYRELLASAGPPSLLHGDLHHGNILDSGDGAWTIIDPKGILGEPAFDTAAFLQNPMPELGARPDLSLVLRRRIAQLSDEAGLDRERIQGWAFAQTVLSALDALEDGDDEGHDSSANVAAALLTT